MTPLPERRQPQHQGSLTSQIEVVRSYFRRETPADETITRDPRKWAQIANMLGCYDAADHFADRQTINFSECGDS